MDKKDTRFYYCLLLKHIIAPCLFFKGGGGVKAAEKP